MAFITIDGENLIAYKNGHSEVLNVTHFVLANIAGLGAEPVSRIEAMPIAGDIVHTQAVTQHGYVNANQVVYSLAMDSTIGDFDFNWVGLKAAGGELVACAHITTQHKTANAGAVPGNNLTRNFLVAFSGIAATTAIAVPAETWQIDFTTRLLQIDDRERLSNFDIYSQASFFDTGFKVSLQSGSTYAIAAGVGYVGGIRCEQAALSTINATGLPKSIWMDASLQGDINGVSAMFSFSATAATLADYTDSFGFKHYLTKLADISAGGVVTDLRNVSKDDAGLLGAFYRSSAPSGWLKANGGAVIVTSYARLAGAIYCGDANNATALAGYRCNNSDGTGRSTTGAYIVLPDLRGEFVRGWDDGRGVDTARLLGSYQIDKFKNHDHKYYYSLPEAPYIGDGYGVRSDATQTHREFTESTTSMSTAGGDETRPRNIAALICINYRG